MCLAGALFPDAIAIDNYAIKQMAETTFNNLTKKEMSLQSIISDLNNFFKKNLDIVLSLARNLRDEFAKDAAMEVLRMGLQWTDEPDLTLQRVSFLKDMGVILQADNKKQLEAIGYLKEGLELGKTLSGCKGEDLAEICFTLAAIYRTKKEADTSIDYFE